MDNEQCSGIILHSPFSILHCPVCVHCGQPIRPEERAFWYWPPDGTCAERLHTACTLAWLARVGEPVVVRLLGREERDGGGDPRGGGER